MEGETLEAGPSLDGRIAVEVMGFTRTYVDSAAPEVGVLWIPFGEDSNYFCPLPRYSTDREAALQVVDRLTEAGLYVAMSRGRQTNWDVRGWSEDNRARFIAHADNLALAICRAALDTSVLEYLRSREGGAVTNP